MPKFGPIKRSNIIKYFKNAHINKANWEEIE